MRINSTKDNLQIIYEDNHLIIVNKRVGDIVQGDKTNDKPLSEVVKEYIAEKYNKPGNVYLGVVHRLDRPTSGIIIFAKTSKALSRLNKMLRDKEIKKTYLAIVENPPQKKSGTLTHYLRKHPKNNKAIVFKKDTPDTKKAILHYKVFKELDNYTVLEIDLETGRHHQIRAQLSSINCTIKGDLKYGAKRSSKDGGIYLHAYKIDFIHPVKKEKLVCIAKPANNVLWNALSF